MSRRPRNNAVSVELFPFLAVLMCAMGALLLLLVVIARQARLQAALPAPESAAVARARDELFLRIGRLRQDRAGIEADIARRQAELAALADRGHRLRQRLAELDAENGDSPSLAAEDLQAELARLLDAIAVARAELDAVRHAAAGTGRSYQIVPYVGPNGTHRRPIYIECTADAVVLQPEGIVLTEDDFQGPLGRDNPLAAAAREASRYLGHGDPLAEPYPLLLVRPDGIGAYYVARAALRAWDGDFGYELIDADWTIAYDEPDQLLKQKEELAVAEARAQQRLLLAASGGSGASGGGGAGGFERSRGGGSRRGGDGQAFRVPAGGGGVVPTPGQEPSGRRPKPRSFDIGAEERSESDAARSRGGGSSPRGGQPQPLRPRTEDAVASDEQAEPSEWHPGEYQERPNRRADSSAPGSSQQSLAEMRGQNWGLPDAAGSSVGLTRPIRVRCEADRLTILPDRRRDPPADAVLLGERTGDSVDELVNGVWEHMERWGIAGKGMYWKPILQVEVAEGGEDRFQDLEQLLDDSGMVVRRAGETPATAGASGGRR